MMNNLLKFLKVTAVLFVILLSANQNTYATHAMGADITYKSLGNNKYLITWEFYFDCSSIVAMPSTEQFSLHSTSCNFDTTFTMTMNLALSNIEVTPICPNNHTTCTNGTFPGVKVYIYQDTLDLGTRHCSDFYIAFSMNARNGNINTIVLPGSTSLTVFTLLNDSIGLNNNSPTFSSLPVPYICMGQTYCYNNGTTDQDGDSLVYSMITPLSGGTYPANFTTVTYNPTFNDTVPITCAFDPSFDTLSGTVCVHPSALDVGVMAILVSEYRHGILVGQVERDIQINVINCTNNIPTLTGIDSSVTVFNDTICSQVPFTFTIYSGDIDALQIDTMWWNGSIPGATFTVTGSPHPIGTFTWTPPASAANTISYCFTVTVRDNACPYEGIQTKAYCLRVVGANIGFEHGNVCTYDVSFHDTSTIIAGTITGWHWNFGDTASGIFDTASGQSPHHIYTDTGFFQIQLVTSSSWGCNDTAYTTIHVQIGQTVVSTSTDANCSNSNDGTAHAVVTSGGIAPFTFHWSNNATSASVTGLGAGIYYISVTDSVGCLVVDTITVHAPPALVSPFTQHNVYCHDSINSGAAFTNTSGGTGPYHYTWSPGAATTASITSLDSGFYHVTVTDAHGCSITNTYHITAQHSLGVDSAQVNVSCFGGNNGQAMIHVFSENEPFTYIWTPTLTNSATVSNLTAGNYLVYVKDTANPVCGDSVHFTIMQHSKMTVILDTAQPILCNGNLSLAVVVDTGGTGGTYNYTWSTSPVQHAATATGLIAGTYSVTVTDSLGCLVDTSITITQPLALGITHAHTDAICFNDNNGTATATVTGGTTNYSYSWSPSGGNNANATGLIAGQYVVVITDFNGCTLTDTVIVGQPTDLVASVIPTNEIICADTTIAIGATGSNGSPGYTFSWSNGSNNQFQNIHPTSSTVYTVTVTDSHGCIKTKDVTITVNPLPLPLDSGTSVCWGDSSRIWVWNTQQGWNYHWANHSGTDNSITFLSGTTVIDSVQVTDGNGCKSKWIVDSGFIKGPHVIADFTSDSVKGFQPFFVNFTNLSQNSDFNIWVFGDYWVKPTWADTMTSLNAFHMFDSAGTFIVTLITVNQYGCADTARRTITVEKTSRLVVWNTISPNGDGKNDQWLPDFHNIATSHCVIFNRWGLKVKEWTTLTGWDGTDNGGSVVPDGTYYFILYCQGVDFVNYNQHGFITVIR